MPAPRILVCAIKCIGFGLSRTTADASQPRGTQVHASCASVPISVAHLLGQATESYRGDADTEQDGTQNCRGGAVEALSDVRTLRFVERASR